MTQKLPLPHERRPDTPAERVSDVEDVTSSEEIDAAAQALVGRVLAGRYRATKVLGQGGIGVVLEAMHLELDKKVAVKVLQAGFARDAEALERFEREAKTAAKIGHPNIVSVLDLGRLETGEPFFVMEYLSGRDLEAEMQMPRRVLPVKRMLEVLGPVAAALDALHAENVVHRDVKPANVFLSETKKGEVVKLVDFGLATLADAERKGARLTREGFIVGTAEYIAPECARGALGGPQSDVYSLAVIAYEALSGLLPFEGAPLDVLLQKVSQVAPRLSKIAKGRFGGDVDDVLARSLDRDPKRRHESCAAFVDDLRQALDKPYAPAAGDSGTARAATGDLPTLPTSSGRNAVVGGIAVVLVLGLGIAGWQFLGNAPAPTAALATTPTTPTAPPEPAPLAVPEPTTADPPVSAELPPEPEPVAAPAGGTTPPAGGTERRVRREGVAAAADPRPEPAPVVVAPVVTPPEPTPAEPEEELEATTHASAADLVRQAQSALLHGEVAAARDLFRDATRVSPRHAAAWRGLGIASEQLHEIPEARRAFERYLEIAPDAADAGTIRERIGRLGG